MDKKLSEILLKIGAVFLRPDDPFTWASGIKSPIYTDNRLILSEPKERDYVESLIAKTVKNNFIDCEILMGTSTAGIAHAALAASILGLPMGYVRSSNKTHGRQNIIEGKLYEDEKVVVIEDLVSTGKSVLEVVDVLREKGADVLGVVSIFTYGMKVASSNFEKCNVKCLSLTDLDTTIQSALEMKLINKTDESKLYRFRDCPSDESWIEG